MHHFASQSGAAAPSKSPGQSTTDDMPDPTNNPDIWHLAFEQTPKVLQWVLGVLTCGLFTLAGWAWRLQNRNVERVERQVHQRMDRSDARVERVEAGMNQRMDEMNHHLIEIAQNTRRK